MQEHVKLLFFPALMFCWQQITMSKIYLRNTQNGFPRDRGTKDFTVELSQDMAKWYKVKHWYRSDYLK